MPKTIDNPNQLIAVLFAALDEGLSLARGPLSGKRPRYTLTIPDADDVDHERFTRGYMSFNGMDVTISMFSGRESVEREVPPFDISKNPNAQQLSLAMMVLKRFADGAEGATITPQDAQRIHDAIADEFRVLSKPAQPKLENEPAIPNEDFITRTARWVEEAEKNGRPNCVAQTADLRQLLTNAAQKPPLATTGPDDFPKPTMPPAFVTDYRTENPKLHKLYVGWALEMMLVAKRCCDDLFGMSRWPANHMAQLLWSEVGRTIVADAAWWDAAALLGARIDLTDYLPEDSAPGVQEAVMQAQEA